MWRLQQGCFPFWWNIIFYAEFCLLDKLYIAMSRLSFVHHDELMGQIGHDVSMIGFILACANVLSISWVTCIKNCQNQYFDHFQIECWKELNVTRWNLEWKMKKRVSGRFSVAANFVLNCYSTTAFETNPSEISHNT